jgi:hypothetical protein
MHLLFTDIQGILEHGLGQPLLDLVQGLRRHQPVQGQNFYGRAVAYFLIAGTVVVDDLGDTQATQDGKQHWDRTQRLGQLIVNVLFEFSGL